MECSIISSQSSSSQVLQKSSRVLETPAADPQSARDHFASRLMFETDHSDVYADLTNKVSGILVIDARTPEAFAKGHVPGAISLPYRRIDRESTSAIPKDKVLVTYCDGVFCNASTKAAARLTALGFRAKEMLDGMAGWRKEGYPVEEAIFKVSTPDR